jgi:DNA-binding transcriptional regulator GbsR (MarR family)
LNTRQRQFVEEMSLMVEHTAMPRMAGRVLGWLLICDPPEQTAAQIVDALEASAGSVSTMTRLLERAGFLELVAVAGSRSKHFRLKAGAWTQVMQQRMQLVALCKELAERGLQLVSRKAGAQNRLTEMRDYYAYMENQLPALFAGWDRTRHRKAG